MKRWKPLAVGIGALVVATAAFVPLWTSTRGVRLIPPETSDMPRDFDPLQSVALFIGVGHFKDPRATEVEFAADDAVDLAYTFTLDPNVRMVDPARAIVAISSDPTKHESRKRLAELDRAGVRIVRTVDADDIVDLVREQAARVDKGGIYVLSLATHGFMNRGASYVLGSSSRWRDPATSLSAAEIADIVSSSRADRSLLFIDACRQRLNTRGTRAKPQPTASFFRRMKRVHGQVVFAAANGIDTYDHDGNGVFTRAVIEGLQCKAAQTRGMVTVANLSAYVEREVKEWMTERGDDSIRRATYVSMEGTTRNMPLARCNTPSLAIAALSFSPVSPRTGIPAELDGDTEPEIIDVTATGIDAIDHDGKRLWSYESDGAPRRIAIGERLYRNTYIAALFANRLVVLNANGDEVSVLESDAIRSVDIYRPTPRYGSWIVVATDRAVLVLKPTDVANVPAVGASVNDVIERVEITDRDKDRRREIELTLRSGGGYILDFKPRGARRMPNTKADIVLLPVNADLTAAEILGR